MPKDITVILANRPGTLADVAEAFAGAGINMLGACGFPAGDEGIMHVLLGDGDAERGRRAVEDAGMEVRTVRDVLVVPVAKGVGGAAAVLRPIADAGVNVDLIYLTEDGDLVLGPEDVQAARTAIGS